MDHSRRAFVASVAAGAVAAAAERIRIVTRPVSRLAGPPASGNQEDERFWERVRAEYPIAADRLFFNPATLGPQPCAVVDAVIEHTRRTAETHPPGTDWPELKALVGRFLGADPDGLVFTRNTTEAMNFVANGLDLGPGDEVLTTDQEHIGGVCCWELLEARRGVALRRIGLPVPAAGGDVIVERFRAAITPRTRVISISHVTFTNGAVLPVAAIAGLCREHGVVCVVDGAQAPGMIRVDMDALGRPDFYATSPHKWLGAPQGTGLLWMRDEWRDRLWPTIASGGWNDPALGAHRLNHLGTLDGSRLTGLEAAIRFQDAIGIDRIERRVRRLRHRLHASLAAMPGVRMMSPADATLSTGMVSFRVEGLDSLELQQRLARTGNVRTRVISEYDLGWMRLSPHIYNPMAEVDRLVGLLAGQLP